MKRVGAATPRPGWNWLWPETGAANTLPALDGVRAMAVLLVLIYHAWHITGAPAAEDSFPLFWTRTGVHLFFVLSGFLLFMPYAQWLFETKPRPSSRRFYIRRILRVGPAYWLCLALLAAAAPITKASLADAATHATFLFNVLPQSIFTINPVFWTMAVEVQFYALLPLIALAVYAASWWVGPTRAVAGTVVVLVLISTLSGVLGSRLDPNESRPVLTAIFGQWSVTFYLAVFAFGMAGSVVYVYLREVATLKEAIARRLGLGLFLGGVLLAVGLALAAPLEVHYSFGKNTIFGVAYGLIVMGVLIGPRLVRVPFETRALRFVGLISYSLYLWHAIAFHLVRAPLLGIADSNERLAVGFLVELAVAVPIAYVSYLVAERPFILARARQRDLAAPALEAGVPTLTIKPSTP